MLLMQEKKEKKNQKSDHGSYSAFNQQQGFCWTQ